jgi:DNA repair exonuclease SbcCD ATPase subunit
LRDQIKIEWDQSKDIQEFFTEMEEARDKIESWGATANLDEEGRDWTVEQMEDSGLFEEKFLRVWEMKPDAEKTWTTMKEYFKTEYDGIKMFGDTSKRRMETINNVVQKKTEAATDVTDLLDTIRRDAMVGSEQIQQMATSFKGATDTMGEVMDRLKMALDQIKTLNNTIATLMATNKQLTDTIKILGGKTPTPQKEEVLRQPSAKETNPNNEKCPLCEKVHGMPWQDNCWLIEKNKNKRPSYHRKRNNNTES